MEDDALFAFIIAFLGIIFIFGLIGLVMYIFQAIGLFKIAKREGHGDKAWLAWIPIANTFLMTILLERAVHEGLRNKLTLVYGIAVAATVVLSGFIPFVAIAPGILFYYVFYFLAKRYSTNPVLHLVIAIVTGGFAVGIQIFIFRNREPVDTTGLAVAATEEDINL